MLVCLCKGVTDRKIRWLVQNGKTCLKDVVRTCQAGTDCGSCIGQVKELVDDTCRALREERDELEPATGA
jgi:bacterioferritin-associated ferredoxin